MGRRAPTYLSAEQTLQGRGQIWMFEAVASGLEFLGIDPSAAEQEGLRHLTQRHFCREGWHGKDCGAFEN